MNRKEVLIIMGLSIFIIFLFGLFYATNNRNDISDIQGGVIEVAVDVNFLIDLDDSNFKIASDDLKTDYVNYQHENVPGFIHDKIYLEQRIGDVLIEPKWLVILPSMDLDDLISKMSDLDDIVLDIVNNGGRVILNFQAVPRWLSSDPTNEGCVFTGCVPNEKIWYSVAPSDYSQWQEVMKEFVNHYNNVLSTNGNVLYMIGNEPDNYWMGSEVEFWDYYKFSVLGALEADPNVKIGGVTPASYLANNFFNAGQPTAGNRPILRNWIEFSSDNSLPIDFVTFHSYPAASPIPRDSTRWDREERDINTWLSEFGFVNVELMMQDWPEWQVHVDDSDNEIKSAWIANSFIGFNRRGSSTPVYLGLKDTEVDQPVALASGSFGGGTGLTTVIGAIKPVYNFYSMISLIDGVGVNVDTQDEFIDAMVYRSVSGDKVYILVSQFVPPDWLVTKNDFLPGLTYLDLRAFQQEVAASGMSQADFEQLLIDVIDGVANIDSLTFPEMLKDVLRGMEATGIAVGQRLLDNINLNIELSNIDAGDWILDEYIIDSNDSNGFPLRITLQSDLDTCNGDNACWANIVQLFNDQDEVKLAVSSTNNIQINGNYIISSSIEHYGTHLFVLTKDTPITVADSSSSGGGGGGGSSSTKCVPNIICGEYGECINTRQKRECYDDNGCEANYTEILECISSVGIVTSTTLDTTTTTLQIPAEVKWKPSRKVVVATSASALVIAALSAVGFIRFKKKPRTFKKLKVNKSKQDSSKILRKYINENLKKGHKKEAIRKVAIKQGWPKDVVDNLLKKK